MSSEVDVVWSMNPSTLISHELAQSLPQKITLHGEGIQFYIKSFYYAHLVRALPVEGTDEWECSTWYMESPTNRPANTLWDYFELPLEVEAVTHPPRIFTTSPRSLSSYEWKACRSGYLDTYTRELSEAEYNTLYAFAINIVYEDANIHREKGPYVLDADGKATPVSAANPLFKGTNILSIAK